MPRCRHSGAINLKNWQGIKVNHNIFKWKDQEEVRLISHSLVFDELGARLTDINWREESLTPF